MHYEAPEITDLGTVAELTAGSTETGGSDLFLLREAGGGGNGPSL